MRIGVIGVGRIGAFHARTLRGLAFVDGLVITDPYAAGLADLAADLGAETVPDVDALLGAGVDAIVITTPTTTHGGLLRAGIEAGVPTFCEKPVAADLAETIDLARLAATSSVPVQIGFQRRFDSGYRAAKAAVESGELGFVHTLRANTHDAAPPHASYIPTSGGIFRDCNIHDFDIIRFVTGREVVTAYATGGNKGADFFRDAGDVDSGAALLTLDDGTTALVSSTRYNGAGHDVRLEVMGELGSIGVGLDDSLAMRSAQEGVTFPAGPVVHTFMERFQPAYVAELTAFADVVRGARPSPCTVADGLAAARIAEACTVSLHEGRVVSLDEIAGGS